jgi:hypothetical protein
MLLAMPLEPGFGSIHVYGDGTVEYIKGLSTIFKVRVQEVTGFTVSKGKSWYNHSNPAPGSKAYSTTSTAEPTPFSGDSNRLPCADRWSARYSGRGIAEVDMVIRGLRDRAWPRSRTTVR